MHSRAVGAGLLPPATPRLARGSRAPGRGPGDRRHPGLRWWWRETGGLRRAGLDLDQAKCAATFEATRRRSEVQAAVQARQLRRDWQIFSGLVWGWASRCWDDLTTAEQARLLQETLSPLFKPPVGYSFFSRDSSARQQATAWTSLPVPANDDCQAAVEYVQRCRRYEDAGCLVGAVLNTSHVAARSAGMALEALPRSVSAWDVRATVLHRETSQGAQVLAQVHLPARARFCFDRIMLELEAFDERGTTSPFMLAIRL